MFAVDFSLNLNRATWKLSNWILPVKTNFQRMFPQRLGRCINCFIIVAAIETSAKQRVERSRIGAKLVCVLHGDLAGGNRCFRFIKNFSGSR